MIISATLTFAMLALAREVGDPYWVWLLHAQEISLCFFMFFASGIFLRTLEKSGGIIKGPRGRIIVQKPEGRWKIMLAVLFHSLRRHTGILLSKHSLRCTMPSL